MLVTHWPHLNTYFFSMLKWTTSLSVSRTKRVKKNGHTQQQQHKIMKSNYILKIKEEEKKIKNSQRATLFPVKEIILASGIMSR